MNKNGNAERPPKLSLHKLADGHCPCITKALGRHLAEAASVCIENRRHPASKPLNVVGDYVAIFLLNRPRVTDQMVRTLADLQEATEFGAVAIAICVVEELTEYQAVYRSAISTGVDYWLADKASEDLGFSARLECSGTLQGGEQERKRRVREKLKQTKQSDASGIPALVVVVDFSDLVSEVATRS